jgi:hypothetical protein
MDGRTFSLPGLAWVGVLMALMSFDDTHKTVAAPGLAERIGDLNPFFSAERSLPLALELWESQVLIGALHCERSRDGLSAPQAEALVALIAWQVGVSESA